MTIRNIHNAMLTTIGVVACGASENTSTNSPSPAAELTSADLKPNPNGGPPAVAPNKLERLRIAGDKMVVPNGEVMMAAQKTGQTLRGSFKFCLDETGHVTAVTMLQTTQVASYDEKIIAAMRRWAYRPVVLDGQAIAVCSAATFIFSVR